MLTPYPTPIDILGPAGALLFLCVVWLFMIGTPVLFVLAIRFLWYRHVYVGRSQELEKLIWQLHRIASALEAERGREQAPIQPPRDAASGTVSNSMFGR